MLNVRYPAVVCLMESQHATGWGTRDGGHLTREELRCLTTHRPSTNTMAKRS
jgi:hypothetical protein